MEDPAWERGSRMSAAVARSVQRFQVGEAGDGANLIDKAEHAGDDDYSAAARLFVAEEQNHARLLEHLLCAADRPTVAGHWSDTVFVRLRRALGLRVELLVLLIAEVVALRYYRALRDGTEDPLTTEVAGRILADERRHVPFHCDRLRQSLAGLPSPARAALLFLWRILLTGTAIVVAADHGKALRALGVPRLRFVADVLAEAKNAAAALRHADC
ncbi:ferritin-like domain-containing protein [Actinomadura alba]|uniref:Ferritin-like domain-containing protein n=2 Tax=Actinomadura alba TaxID=406431 RepID=A0ABR7LGH0_9ACTN|nr:ferritin-like domain-containing protein [Actinomadura alba]